MAARVRSVLGMIGVYFLPHSHCGANTCLPKAIAKQQCRYYGQSEYCQVNVRTQGSACINRSAIQYTVYYGQNLPTAAFSKPYAAQYPHDGGFLFRASLHVPGYHYRVSGDHLQRARERLRRTNLHRSAIWKPT